MLLLHQGYLPVCFTHVSRCARRLFAVCWPLRAHLQPFLRRAVLATLHAVIGVMRESVFDELEPVLPQLQDYISERLLNDPTRPAVTWPSASAAASSRN